MPNAGKNGFQTYICGREEQSRLMHMSAATTSSEGALALWVTLSRQPRAQKPTQPPSDSPQPEDTSGILNDQQDAGCQTDLTMEDIERMEDVLRQNTTELGDLRTKGTGHKVQPGVL
ncbi:hypothetical protein KUCAC02_028990 [Chaenocephalus aceratus]|uniref:Uncharacterized protein n=1 Tax=Chaenocephalus aceratus TaxID=36190 RepID=A0ACB9X3I8_CHAAC|nr:hypothetical protein KUCAC02_028990 [Chaenocephalus aceratus]